MTTNIETIEGSKTAEVLALATRWMTVERKSDESRFYAVERKSPLGNQAEVGVLDTGTEVRLKYAVLDLGSDRASHQLRYVELKNGAACHANYWMGDAEWQRLNEAPDFGDLCGGRAMVENAARGLGY